jgi:ABC-2 type transport system ATP-binding protein
VTFPADGRSEPRSGRARSGLFRLAAVPGCSGSRLFRLALGEGADSWQAGPVISARGLDKWYGSTHAVQDLSFDVRPGVVTGFLGPNGAGKSTTLRLMLGLDRGGGETLFDGVPYGCLRRPLCHVGTVLEARAFHPTRRAGDHLRMLAAANGLPRRRVDEALAAVGLTEVADDRPGTFSLGMGQRLALAGALLGEPHTLLLDEPANGLDPHGIQWLREFLRRLAAEGRTVFVSSHLLAEMALMADDLVVVGLGRLIAAGPVGDFIDRFTARHVLVRSPRADQLAELIRRSGAQITEEDDGALLVTGADCAWVGDLAASYGIAVHELTLRTASLEQAFLEATGGAVRFDAA